MDIIRITRRASDGKISEIPRTCTDVNNVIWASELVLKSKLITGYCIKDAKTGETIVKKGKV